MSVMNQSAFESYTKSQLIMAIVDQIKFYRDFESAAKMLKENNISLYELSNYTVRLTMFDIAKLGDELVKIS